MSLLCLFLGDQVKNRFEISIKKHRTVSRLREAIKNKNKNDLKDIDARQLDLWKVAVPTDHENDKLELLNSKSYDQIKVQEDLGGELLQADDVIKEHFKSKSTTKQISIIIQLPGKSLSIFYLLNKKFIVSSYVNNIAFSLLYHFFFTTIREKKESNGRRM